MIFKSFLVEQNINLIAEKNLILFYGENLGLKNDFKKLIQYNAPENKIMNFTQEEIIRNQERFLSEISNLSLFEKKKIYYINECNDKILEFIKENERVINSKLIYLFSNILDKRSKLRNHFEKLKNIAIIPCYADNEITIRKIILNKLRDFKGLSTENVNLIIDNCNFDRLKLNNELSKIITCFENKNIENNLLTSLLDYKVNDDFNLLKNEALSGEKIKTNRLLSDTVIDPDKNVYYLAIINQSLKKISDTSKLSEQISVDEAINVIRPPIFWKEKPILKKQLLKWNSKKIRQVLEATYNLEIEIKSNVQISKTLLIKKLLVDICELANAS
jgi:DNA polymerase III subunit delta|tara:strand:+ start:2558 stop:3553 length:996 start_codon:yes stop_codon:yes gene_type:complete